MHFKVTLETIWQVLRHWSGLHQAGTMRDKTNVPKQFLEQVGLWFRFSFGLKTSALFVFSLFFFQDPKISPWVP